MAVTREDVLNYLGREEPPYAAAAGLGTGALPHLMDLVRGDDPGLASKAASLAGHIESGEQVIAAGLRRDSLLVRIASAAAIRHLRDVPTDLARMALEDEAPQVRKWGIEAVGVRRPDNATRAALERIAEADPDELLQQKARRILYGAKKSSD